ncbi:GerMN domain-containing protein [Burkholderia sp. RS01]|uniref:GerMN domain-containing protein n=1 Tax=unclassified Burkholderia TaxID=2613784 RepID=UPI00321871A7
MRKTSQDSRTRRAAAAVLCLLFPLWLGSCAPLPVSAPGGSADAAAPAAAPAPQPRPAPPVSPPEEGAPPAAATGPAEGSGSGSAAASGQGAGIGPGAADVPAPASGPPATAAGPAIQDLPSAGAPDAPASAAAPKATGPKNTAPGAGAVAAAGTAVYYVALDDGGTSGVRFGCNDSLVAVHDADPSIREPLHAAMSRLLSGPGAPPATGLYNALSSSTLQYVSGYLDGTTVVVNLTGSVQPGGVCDIPRIEAQLTQTAVTAVGATRAEIYVNGVSLAEVLSLR